MVEEHALRTAGGAARVHDAGVIARCRKESERIGRHLRERRLRTHEILDHDERNPECLFQHPRGCTELLARDEQAGLGVLEHRAKVAVVHTEVQSDVHERCLVGCHEVFDDFAAVG
jgi:hypothetical protein